MYAEISKRDVDPNQYSNLWKVTGDFGPKGNTLYVPAWDLADLYEFVATQHPNTPKYTAKRYTWAEEERVTHITVISEGETRRCAYDEVIGVEITCDSYGDAVGDSVKLWQLAAFLGHPEEDDETPLNLDALIGTDPVDTKGWSRLFMHGNYGDAANLHIVNIDTRP
ncbi:hypothetical protein DMC64_41910 [Amycolatopsis sp. WAC 04197]|uniref:hypothetical protein n=1 Tax=Amycolatopsis sp. WAC 04197 TaxID=2203199 RepID=UPI000F79097F|nr:hypothetical protein [Amycolatopsis sp. WAC 04197]RSN38625.1 hypothetical protein DMC64_41910 [Amycolatopsis sp. WAC 04197]